MNIADNIRQLRQQLPEGVELVAVSKFHPVEDILEAYGAGQRSFGESRVQELLEKLPAVPQDIDWHFIGHLQTNKVKQLVGNVSIIESVDSERLLELIDKLSAEKGVESRVLLQVHIAQEDSKFGFTPQELSDFFEQEKHKSLRATHICGLMGMATNTDDEAQIKADFAQISQLFKQIACKFANPDVFNILSIGMSDDYPLAIAAGSTSVRIGTAIFGQRL